MQEQYRLKESIADQRNVGQDFQSGGKFTGEVETWFGNNAMSLEFAPPTIDL